MREELNRYLDGEGNIENASEQIKREYIVYRKIITVMQLRTDYVPSEVSKNRFINNIKRIKRRKRLGKFSIGVAIAAAVLLVYLGFSGAFVGSNLSVEKAEINNDENNLAYTMPADDLSKLENIKVNDVDLSEFEKAANSLELLQLLNDGF